jgi:hypothetical protein
MKFYRNNRIDEPFDMELEELAELFLASPQASWEWPLDRAIPHFLGDPDGPVSGVWENQKDYMALRNLVADRRRERQS